ncbi:hypothetical protein WEH80_36005 [Actinomycetes bacterium KLBMP 9759]
MAARRRPSGMSTLRTRVPVAVAAVLVGLSLLACGRPPGPDVEGEPIPVEVVEFDPQAYGLPVAALTTEPVRMRVFAGWFARAERNDSGEPDVVVPRPGHTWLAVGGGTGCQVATGVEVRRVGDDLRVRFVVPDIVWPEGASACVRSFGPVALLSLPTTAVDGVRTVGGVPPVAASGPGVLTGFVRLRSGPPTAVEIGRDDAALAESVESNPAARAALGRPTPAGPRAFAFVLTGCGVTGAVLLVAPDGLSAESVGGEGIACYAPEHYLATFDVPADRVPEPALAETG